MIRELHEWNALGSCVLSTALNALLIWLVVYRSPREMHQYSRIVLQTALVDLQLSAMFWIVQPEAPLQLRFALLEVLLLIHFFTVSGLCVQFVYRYLILIKDATISHRRYLLMMLAPQSVVVGACALLWWIGYPNAQNEAIHSEHIAELLLISNNNNGTNQTVQGTLVSEQGPRWLLIAIFLFAFHAVLYAIMAFCGHRMLKRVQPTNGVTLMDTEARKRMAKINRELTKSLCMLAIIPIVLLCSNAAVLTTLVLSGGATAQATTIAEMLATVPVHWLPVLNPLVTISTVKPYLRAIVAFGKVQPSTVAWATQQ